MAQQWSFNVNAVLGGKFLEENDWGKFDEQYEFVLMADAKKKDWPVSLVANLFYLGDSTSDYDDSWRDDSYRYTYYA